MNKRPAAAKRLAPLERRLTSVGTADAKDVRALRAARKEAARNGIFAQLYRRGGKTIALIEGSNRVVKRLKPLAKKLDASSAGTTSSLHADGGGCTYFTFLSLSASGTEIGSREVFTSPDGCLFVRVYELEDVAQVVSYRAMAPDGSVGSRQSGPCIPDPPPPTAVDTASAGPCLPDTPVAAPEPVGSALYGAGADAGAQDDTELRPNPTATGGARDVNYIGWAWPDEIYAQGRQAEDAHYLAWDTGRSVVGGLSTAPTLNTSSAASASYYYGLAEANTKSMVESKRAKGKTSAGLYAAWYEDPPGLDVTKTGTQIKHQFYGGCVHNPVYLSTYEHTTGTTGWFKVRGNTLKNKNCGSTYISRYAYHKNNKFCATRDTHVEYDRVVLMGDPDGRLDGSGSTSKRGGCVQLLRHNEKLRRDQPFNRCQGDCSKDDDG